MSTLFTLHFSQSALRSNPDDILITFGSLNLDRVNQGEFYLIVCDPQSLSVQRAESSAVFTQEVKLPIIAPWEESCEIRKLAVDFLLVDQLLADDVKRDQGFRGEESEDLRKVLPWNDFEETNEILEFLDFVWSDDFWVSASVELKEFFSFVLLVFSRDSDGKDL
jgi:hypothetical protein